MRVHEVECFRTAMGLSDSEAATFDLLNGALPKSLVDSASMVLLGGSGKYSAAGEGAWMERALDSLRLVYESKTPTFASCWGFQAMARAMGGTVEHHPENAEVGTYTIELTDEGRRDALFGQCGERFAGHLGHEDFVTRLPPRTTLLAHTERSRQAFRFDDRPIYCTQFHPELTKADMVARLTAYPEYVERIDGKPGKDPTTLDDTPVAAGLLKQFASLFLNETDESGELL